MTNAEKSITAQILEQSLPNVVFDGWNMAVIEQGAVAAGYEPEIARAVFPGGVADVLDGFADWLDMRMLEALDSLHPDDMRVRDRIYEAVMARFRVMQEWREAERLALRYWGAPGRQVRASKILWRTSDRIWTWAGDTSADYNRYTKRGLLSGVIGATTLAWLNEDGGVEDMARVERFLQRRIDNVLTVGGLLRGTGLKDGAGQLFAKFVQRKEAGKTGGQSSSGGNID